MLDGWAGASALNPRLGVQETIDRLSPARFVGGSAAPDRRPKSMRHCERSCPTTGAAPGVLLAARGDAYVARRAFIFSTESFDAEAVPVAGLASTTRRLLLASSTVNAQARDVVAAAA